MGSIYKEIDLGGKSDVWNTALSGDSNIFAGGSITFADNSMGALVMKTNINGIIQWARTLKGPRAQLFRRVYPFKDSGILAVGASSTYPASSNFSALVTRWDKNGNLIWTRSLRINSQFRDWALDVEELSNGEILIVGNINSSGYLASGLTLKLSASGAMIWGKMCRFFEGINFRTSLETPDGYLVAGEYLLMVIPPIGQSK